MTELLDANLTEPDLLASVFEERAENLSKDELNKWTQETPRAKEILARLKGPGAKLLSGPRGCGKSTFLRKAYFELLDSGDVLPVYINYAKSLALEPLFHHRANAIQVFRQWVLAKVIDGVAESFLRLGKPEPVDLSSHSVAAKKLVHDLETGEFQDFEGQLISPTDMLALLESWTRSNGFRRCVLLMDDAAHAFSPDQQREFFEIFRLLRSRVISAKAAVYPGITSYSPHFHVGHEAELLEAWHTPDDPQFITTMRSIASRRLPQYLYAQLQGKQELIDYLALASFGLPRGFINMLQQLLAVEDIHTSVKASRAQADAAIKSHAASVRGIFLALRNKLPRFRHFITIGSDVESSMCNALRTFNRDKSASTKAVVVAIPEPLEGVLEKILSFLEYAGIIRSLDKVSRGVKGRFRRYVMHYAVVITENALNLGKNASVESAIESLSKRDAHAFVRVAGAKLLGEGFEQRCKLDLSPCQKCKAPRMSEEQRFCMKCGAQLAEASIYGDLIRAQIADLPLTERKINDIYQFTTMRTVQDILMDDELRQVLSVPHVGPVWASRIRNAAEEYVSV